VLSLRNSKWMVEKMKNLLGVSPNSRLVITLYRDNLVFYNTNHKDYGNKAIRKKVFAPILNFWTSFQALVWWISAIPKQVSFVCSLVCTIIWSKLLQYAPSCVLVMQIDPGACSRSKTLCVYWPLNYPVTSKMSSIWEISFQSGKINVTITSLIVSRLHRD